MYKKQLCIVLMALFASVAQAQTETHSGFYIGAERVKNGTSFTQENKEADYSNFGGRIFFGKKIDDVFAVEGGFMFSPEHVKKERSTYYSQDYALTTQALDTRLVITPIQSLSGLKLKVGLALMGLQLDKKIEGRYSSAHTTAKTVTTGLVGGIAYEHPITENVFINAGYTRYMQIAPNAIDTFQALDHDHNVFSFGIKKQF